VAGASLAEPGAELFLALQGLTPIGPGTLFSVPAVYPVFRGTKSPMKPVSVLYAIALWRYRFSPSRVFHKNHTSLVWKILENIRDI
jgi:hypothetical protein